MKAPILAGRVAAQALIWREKFNRGGTSIGVARAVQLKNNEDLSDSTIARMWSFFRRHEVDKKAEGFRRGEKGFPSAGRVAWDLWGGDPAYNWLKRVYKRTEERSLRCGSIVVSLYKPKSKKKKAKAKGESMPYLGIQDEFKRLIECDYLDLDRLDELRARKPKLPSGKMTPEKREKIPKKLFVFPDEKSWPIHDIEHGKIALVWSTWPQHKNVAKTVRSAVFKKYPSLKKWFKGGRYAKEESLGVKLGDNPKIAERLQNLSNVLSEGSVKWQGRSFKSDPKDGIPGNIESIIEGVMMEAAKKLNAMVSKRAGVSVSGLDAKLIGYTKKLYKDLV
jgi:hypothetical protein